MSKSLDPNQIQSGLSDLGSGSKLLAKVTVNSEIFARVLFSRNFAYAKFRENKTLAIWRDHSVIS